MRRAAVVLLATVLAGAAGACGDGGGSEADVGVSLEMRHTEPLQAGAPVRWTLVLRNDRPDRLRLQFASGKDGDVVLRQGGEERYRWSTGHVFTAALRRLDVGANETRTFALEDPALDVAPGEYDLVATLATDKSIPAFETKVTVTA